MAQARAGSVVGLLQLGSYSAGSCFSGGTSITSTLASIQSHSIGDHVLAERVVELPDDCSRTLSLCYLEAQPSGSTLRKSTAPCRAKLHPDVQP